MDNISRRDYFAIAALSLPISLWGDDEKFFPHVAKMAVKFADALIAELDKDKISLDQKTGDTKVYVNDQLLNPGQSVTISKPQKLKLEVGKFYRNRAGGIKHIIQYNENLEYPYVASDDDSFKENGNFEKHGPNRYDLIEEVKVFRIKNPEQT